MMKCEPTFRSGRSALRTSNRAVWGHCCASDSWRAAPSIRTNLVFGSDRCGIEPRKIDIAGADSLYSLEGNMCGTAMRGAVALPGSKATSRAKGSCRNLGGLISDPLTLCLNGPRREGEEPTPAMYGGFTVKLGVAAGCRLASTRYQIAELAAGKASSTPIPPAAYQL
jgi:hypothetical protein